MLLKTTLVALLFLITLPIVVFTTNDFSYHLSAEILVNKEFSFDERINQTKVYFQEQLFICNYNDSTVEVTASETQILRIIFATPIQSAAGCGVGSQYILGAVSANYPAMVFQSYLYDSATGNIQELSTLELFSPVFTFSFYHVNNNYYVDLHLPKSKYRVAMYYLDQENNSWLLHDFSEKKYKIISQQQNDILISDGNNAIVGTFLQRRWEPRLTFQWFEPVKTGCWNNKIFCLNFNCTNTTINSISSWCKLTPTTDTIDGITTEIIKLVASDSVHYLIPTTGTGTSSTGTSSTGSTLLLLLSAQLKPSLDYYNNITNLTVQTYKDKVIVGTLKTYLVSDLPEPIPVPSSSKRKLDLSWLFLFF